MSWSGSVRPGETCEPCEPVEVDQGLMNSAAKFSSAAFAELLNVQYTEEFNIMIFAGCRAVVM